MYKLLALLFFLQPAVVLCQVCATGWTLYGDNCYKQTSDQKNWHEAQISCQNDGGNLAMPKTQEITDVLVQLITTVGMSGSHWIGVHDISLEGDFVFVDNTPVTNPYWNAGEPNNVGSVEDCAEAVYTGLWNDQDCYSIRPYICQRDNDVIIKCDEGNGWMSAAGRCYKFYDSLSTWQDADDYCQAVDGHLISISSEEEQSVVTTQANFGGSTIWIGLSDFTGDYKWSSGESITYTNWGVNQPDSRFSNSGGNCVEVLDTSNNGEWSTMTCTATQNYICERAEGTCPEGWRLFRGYCYQFNTNTKSSWTDAKHICEAQGAYLITVLSDVENDYVRDQLLDLENIGITSTWMGLSDTENDGLFAWVEGSSLGYTNWDANEPTDNANSPDCGSIRTAGGSGKWSTKNCYTLEAYVCKVQTGQPVFPLNPNSAIGSCEAGWTLNRDNCYYLVNSAAYFDEAEADCVSKGGHVTSVNDQEEQSFLSMRTAIAQRNLYIGFQDKNSEDNFEWTDGSPVTFTNWGPNQPDDWSDDGQDCTFMKWEEDVQGIWDDINCDKTRVAYVCKKPKIPGVTQPAPAVPTPVFDPRCGAGWEYDILSGNCYLFRPTDYKNWDNARMECKLGGGELLSIADSTEQTYINARLVYVTQSSLWIGANDLSSEGGWQWSDGSGFAYLNWSPDEPNDYDPGEHCTQIYYATGQWNDYFCDRDLGYICKKNGYLTTHYNVVPSSYLDGADTVILQNIYPEDCAKACYDATDFTCRSFDYRRATMECALSDSTKDMGPVLLGSSETDYYQRLMDVVDPAPTTLPPGYRCRNGWAPYGSNCYYIQTSVGTYSEALSQCKALGADLASVHDENENNFIQALYSSAGINSAVWLGLTDLRVQMLFEWSDGTPVDYTFWNNAEPNNYGDNNEDCVEMFNTGAWNDISCASAIPSVCKLRKEDLPPTDQPITPSGCNLGEVGYGSSCYRAVTVSKGWNDAVSDCMTIGGNLVSIADRYEQSVVSSMLGLQDGTLFWIGLSDQAMPGQYAWSDNTEVTYSHWDVGQPTDNAGYCVAASSGSPAGLWKNIACNSTQKYLCERVRDGYTARPTVPAPGPPTPASDDGCYYDWIGYGGNCFKLETGEDPTLGLDETIKVKRTWSAARDLCIADGADLASFHDPAEEAYIKAAIPMPDDGYWIGLHDRSVEAGFEWSDRTAVDYTNWWDGEPNNAGEIGEDCTEMFGNHRDWNDIECTVYRNWICKMPKGQKPKSTLPPSTVSPWPQCPIDPDWVLYNNNCYFFSGGLSGSERALGFSDANQYCMNKGGYLVSVHSTMENDFLRSMLNRYAGSTDWIGLRTYSGTGYYEWTDGSPLDYQSWNINEPNDSNGEEECAEFYEDGSWNDLNCGDKLTFVCKKSVSAVNPVTRAPTPVPDGNCPFGTLRFDNMCYKIIGDNSADRNTWYNARDICRNQYNGDLATMHSQAIQSFFITQMKGIDYQIYIGLSDSLNNGKFRWTDGSSVDFTNWNSDEPNDHNGDEDCVEMVETPEKAGKWNDQTCQDYNAFICQSPLDLTAPAPPADPTQCTDGFTQYGDSCFKVISRGMTFSDANQACRNEGSRVTLASIVDNYEQAYAETMVHYNGDTMLWLGLLDDKVSGQYKWLDSHPVWYTNWGQGEPSNGAGEGCTAIGLDGWDDHQCEDQLGALCKYSLVETPTEHPDVPGTCPDSWLSYGSNCYLFADVTRDSLSWPSADYFCKQSGGHLASIHTKQENEWIRNNMELDYTDIWIGFEATPSSSFAWTDNTPVDYTNWNPGEPNSNFIGDEDCAEMYLETGKWNDLDCLTLQGYVCKTPKTPISGGPTIAPPKTQAPGKTTQKDGSVTNNNQPTAAPVVSSSTISTGAIIGIVIAVVILVCLTALIMFFMYSKRNAPMKTPDPTLPKSTGFENVVYDEKNGTTLTPFDSTA